MENRYVKIVGIDESGDQHTLWESPDYIEKMPELATGMFIKLCDKEHDKTRHGFVYDGKIIWQHGGWDDVSDIHKTLCDADDCDDLYEMTIYQEGLYYFPLTCEYPKLWSGKVWY